MYVRHWMPSVASNGKTALLIHGLASSSLTWVRVARHLSGQGYDVYAPDLAGHGHSDHRARYSVDEWTADILELGYQPDLIVGHSIGGLIAANLSLHYDAKMVLLDPVFRLPKQEFLVRQIQGWFAWATRHSYFPLKPARTNIIERWNARRWDMRSVRALAKPHAIAQTFLDAGKGGLMIRAKRSFIFPAMKQLPEGYVVESYKVGHNIHIAAFDNLRESLERYLGAHGTPTAS